MCFDTSATGRYGNLHICVNYGNKARLRLQNEMEGINIADWSDVTRLAPS